MCLADSHLFTYSILQYYHKMLIIGTIFIITLSCDNWPAQARAFVPKSFPPHFLLIFKIVYNKIGDILCSMY